jgi:hypothetical protein
MRTLALASAGGHGVDLGAEGVGDAAEATEGGDAPLHRIGGQLLHVARPRAQPDDLLVAGQDLEAVVAGRPGDDEVDAVGADVDRGHRGGRLGGVRHHRPRLPSGS